MVKSWVPRQIQAEALPCTEQIAEGKSKFQWLCPKADIKKDGILELYRKWMSGNELAKKAGDIQKSDKSLGGVKSDASEALFKELNRRRILTLVREGWYGVKEANAFLLREAKTAAGMRGDYLSMVGVPIMVTHNTPERNLFNGDVGVTVRGPHGMVVLFPRGAQTIACPVALLPEHELAYAMTVHKSQGSEFENVKRDGGAAGRREASAAQPADSVHGHHAREEAGGDRGDREGPDGGAGEEDRARHGHCARRCNRSREQGDAGEEMT